MPDLPYLALLGLAVGAVVVLLMAFIALACWIRHRLDMDDLEER
ncbi:hypothetical protein [Bordetella bronchiseptica]|uniref:Uncharacterized protein n=1 Tax=Bordetella bronchiseptica 00-P-2796 TaxID=1331199 RepID=A0ABR4R7V7_BORBO|nr:hypothetical protein [Bordetella bronchiseptica]KCV30787.1 hypothetical protein L490_1475 [Bordetella bronchiseptica 00-P-2796]KDC15309.1 hypothetical protein L542_2096 [Bordetella bronchiseptica F-1]KDC29264.1 hypothetical protein L504_2122 [Bordetella bronchiseptica F2]